MNSNKKVIRDFGEEWSRFNYLSDDDVNSLREQFERYIAPLPEMLFKNGRIIAADIGAGAGRWSHYLKEYCERLYVVEPSVKAFEICLERFQTDSRISVLRESVERNSIPNDELDLAVSLGVLHHVPNTQEALSSIFTKVKPGGYFLGYLYYAMENRRGYYRMIWRLSEFFRIIISHSPKGIKFFVSELIALIIYLPLARFSALLSTWNVSTDGIPLHQYANLSYQVMRNDALDRFGTTLEQRFTKDQIRKMLTSAGFDVSTLNFSESEPFWTFSIQK